MKQLTNDSFKGEISITRAGYTTIYQADSMRGERILPPKAYTG